MKLVSNSKHGRKKEKIITKQNPINKKLKKNKKKLQTAALLSSSDIGDMQHKSSLRLKSVLEKRKEKKSVSFNLPDSSSGDDAKNTPGVSFGVSLKSENKKKHKNKVKSKVTEETSTINGDVGESKQKDARFSLSDVDGSAAEMVHSKSEKKKRKKNKTSEVTIDENAEISSEPSEVVKSEKKKRKKNKNSEGVIEENTKITTEPSEVDDRFSMPEDKDTEAEVDDRFSMPDDKDTEAETPNELNDSDDDLDIKPEKRSRRLKPGIIYLSSIPNTMNPQTIKQYFEFYGKVGRSYIQPLHEDTTTQGKKRKKKYNPREKFSEGWLEFLSKKVARDVATQLNNTQVGGGKRKEYHDNLWNIKYLPRFKWTHLRERVEYEKMLHNQRMRTEIAQVKKETEHYMEQVQKQSRMQRWETKFSKGLVKEKEGAFTTQPVEFKQSEKMEGGGRETFSSVTRDDVLSSVFGAGL